MIVFGLQKFHTIFKSVLKFLNYPYYVRNETSNKLPTITLRTFSLYYIFLISDQFQAINITLRSRFVVEPKFSYGLIYQGRQDQ